MYTRGENLFAVIGALLFFAFLVFIALQLNGVL
jgi:hypothetical protein